MEQTSQKPGYHPPQAIYHELRTAENSAIHVSAKLQSIKESNPYLKAPWDALREMLRVTKPSGIVAARESDLETECVWPELSGLLKFHKFAAGMNAAGGTPNAGGQLLSWALKAGVERGQITASYST